mgnify:CR=1 FL=1
MFAKFKTLYIAVFISLILFSFVSSVSAVGVPVIVTATIQLPSDIITQVESVLTTIASQASWVLDILAEVKDKVLDPIAWVAAKAQIHSEANTILTQVRGGGNARGETGKALFVTDWEKVSRSAVSNQRRFFLQELAVTKKVDPAFQETLLSSFSSNPNRSVFNRLQSNFGSDVGCDDTNNTGGQSCLQNFLGDFSQGGWRGWNSIVTNPGNNPYRSYLELQAEKERREESARQARINEALASQGALGTQDCVEEPSQEAELVNPIESKNLACVISSMGGSSETFYALEDNGFIVPGTTDEMTYNQCQEALQEELNKPLPESSYAEDAPTIKKCKITRPGTTVASDLSKVLGGPIDTLQQVDEFSELISGALASFIGSLRSQGIASDNESEDIVSGSRTALKDTNIENAKKTLNELSASVTKSISNLAGIWEIKVKSLDLVDDVSPGFIYELNETQKNIDSAGKCALDISIAERLSGDLEDAKSQMEKLALEVGYPINFSNNLKDENGRGDLGYYENGGLYSQELFKQQAILEYLDEVLKKNGDVEPSLDVPNDVTTLFRWDSPSFSSKTRVSMAQQMIGAEVGKISELLTQVGTPDMAKAEQRQINQRMLSQRQMLRSCSSE